MGVPSLVIQITRLYVTGVTKECIINGNVLQELHFVCGARDRRVVPSQPFSYLKSDGKILR